jgi:HK97 family phage prohead protease
MKNNLYSTKGSFELKDMDNDAREVAFYLSKFDVIDSDFDNIRRGAFKKSIEERGPNSPGNRKIAFLWSHNWDVPIGTFKELSEDENGLFAVAQLSTSTAGSDAMQNYIDGVIREHSIGFQYIKDKMKFIETDETPIGGFWDIAEVKLFEGSAVTFGANEYTNVVSVTKTEEKTELVTKITGEMDLIIKALSRGQGTDERLHSLEMNLKYLTGRLALLANVEPFNVKHLNENKPTTDETLFNWETVIKNLSI